MFIANKYTKIYYNIINAAKLAKRKRSKSCYLESHHIIPRSLGGSDNKDNRVLLTAKEHFVCHAILCRITQLQDQEKMVYALFCMKRNNGRQLRYLNSRLYQIAKVQMSKLNSTKQTGSGNSQFGTAWYHNPVTGEAKKLKKECILPYINKGWLLGRQVKVEFTNQSDLRLAQIEKELMYLDTRRRKLLTERDLLVS